MSHPPLILASTSIYRRELLSRLRLPFDVVSPQVDETPVPGETPAATAQRLAQAKARAGAALRPGCLVIGSDQTAAVGELRLDKPGTHERALAQLTRASGQQALFHTAVAVAAPDGSVRSRCVDTTVWFRELSPARIERYLRAEQPYDCAGSAKVEALGITLLREVRSEDPTALVGLPLIALTELLGSFGVDVLDELSVP